MNLNLDKNLLDFSTDLFVLTLVENKETLKHLASLYANNHPSMHMGQPSCPNKSGGYVSYHLLLFILMLLLFSFIGPNLALCAHR